MCAFRFQLPFLLVLLVFVIAGLPFALPASAQAGKPSPAPAQQPQVEENLGGQEDEVVKPVIWSLREVYWNMKGDVWTDWLYFRADKILFRKNKLTGGRGSILRLDFPVAVNSNGRNMRAGLGDIYLQDVLIPYASSKFMFGAGSGLTLPTATDSRLGEGKWVVSPLVAPLWRFPKKGFLLVKLQDYISFAGDSERPDIHRLSVRPVFVWRFQRRWWTQIEGESITNFVGSSRPWFWNGVALGRMTTSRIGLWVQPQVAWGPYRPFDFALRVNLYSVK
jgi:hypothetical protein